MNYNLNNGLITCPNNKKMHKNDKQMIDRSIINDGKMIDNLSKQKSQIIKITNVNDNKNLIKNNDCLEHNKMIDDDNNSKKYICVCSKEFKYNQNYYRHRKACKIYNKTNEFDKKNNNELNEKINSELKPFIKNETLDLVSVLKDIMIELQKHNVQNISSNVIGNTISNNVNNINTVNNINKTFNVFAYICDNFQNVQPIQSLKPAQVVQMLGVDKKWGYPMYRLLIYHHCQHLLDQFIGDIIITSYKKDKPEEQQFWSSDVKKLTFIVRQLLNKNKHVWLRDKQGSYLTECIISPILEEIKQILIRYDKECQSEMEKYEISMDRFDELNNDRSILLKIIKEINIKKIHDKVLIYIAPRFQFEGFSDKLNEIEYDNID